jgi:hypothetical protein
MRALALDWSGARSSHAQRRHIWAAQAEDGRVRSVCGGITREDAIELALAAIDGGVDVVGLDFSFSFPAWFVRSLGADDGPGVWEVAASAGEGWLAACDPPFWGRPGRPRPSFGPGREERRGTEEDVPPGVRRPKGTFQIGGAGAVGTAAVRGMPGLRRFRHAGIAVWPFDDAGAGAPFVAEVYPRWCTGPVVKGRPAARAAHLAGRTAALPAAARDAAVRSEDAFDALCTALALSEGRWRPPLPTAEDRVEGRILAPPGGAAG